MAVAGLASIGIGGLIEAATGVGATVATSVGAATGSAVLGEVASTALLASTSQAVANEVIPTTLEQLVNDVRDASYSIYFTDPRLLVNSRTGQFTKDTAPHSLKPNIDGVVDPLPSQNTGDIQAETVEEQVLGKQNALSIDPNEIIEKKLKNYSPKEISYVIDFLGKEATKGNTNVPKNLQKLSNIDDYYAPLTQSFQEILSSKTMSGDAYKEIEKIYNFNGVSIQNNQIIEPSEEEGRFNLYFLDETGKKNGPMLSNKPGDFYIPAVYGIYGGGQSPNGATGSVIPIDLYDLAFYAHDLGYSVNGYFSYEEDLKLVSRLQSLLNKKIPSQNDSLIRSIITYFTTVGTLMTVIKGNDRVGQDYQEIAPITDDGIFPLAQPLAGQLDEDDYKLERFKFYNQLDEEHLDLLSNVSHNGSFNNTELITDLEQMEIIIV